jgi:hypothetical protein
MATGPIAHNTMAHLHKATKRWASFQAGVATHATRTAGERGRSDRDQTDSTEWHKAQEQTTGA